MALAAASASGTGTNHTEGEVTIARLYVLRATYLLLIVPFALHATRMEQLMAVADAGKLMPPKSTWFEPKLADGLLSHVLD